MRFTSRKNLSSLVFVSFIFIVTLIHLHDYKTTRSEPLWERTLDFDRLQFSNETADPSRGYLVPNYIHFVHFGGTPLKYYQLICVLAAFKNQKPENIFFHYDKETTFSGKYWEVLLLTPGFKDVMVQHKVEEPAEIYGQPLNARFRHWHASDITRIRMIMKYGGIFLDNDCYLIKSVDYYRRFEMSLGWDEGEPLGNQVIIAHKDARFLKKWLECYKVYNASLWYYNSGEKPTLEVLYKQPHLIHRVKVLFGYDLRLVYNFFLKLWPRWRDLYIAHLSIRHTVSLNSINEKAVYPIKFNEKNIGYYPITFREMAYDVYEVANINWPKEKIS